jgi:hypothetical protein
VSLIRYHTLLLTGAQNMQFIKIVVLLVQGLTPTVLSLPPLPTSATKNRNLPIPVHLSSDPPPQTASELPDLPVSSTQHSEEAGAIMAHHTHVLPMLVLLTPGAM